MNTKTGKLDFAPNPSNGNPHRVGFIDIYGCECRIYPSSAACYDALWLSVGKGENPSQTIIMTRDAARLGLPTYGETNGWVKYEIPPEVQIKDSLHLSRAQVEGLVEILNNWLKKGDVSAGQFKPIRLSEDC